MQDRSGELRISSGRPILKKRGGEEGAQRTVVRTKIGEGRRMEKERKSGCQSSGRCAAEAISQGWEIRAILEVGKFPPPFSFSFGCSLSLSFSFLDAEDVYGSSWKREGYGSKIADTGERERERNRETR